MRIIDIESSDFVSARITGGDSFEVRGARRAAKRTKQFLLLTLMSFGTFVVGCAQRPANLDDPAKGRSAAATRQVEVDAAAAKPLTCGNAGSTSSSVVFHGPVTYSATSFVGGEQSTWSLNWSVTNNYTMGHSGNLHAELYAMPQSATADSFSQAGWTGHKIGMFYPKFSGDGTYSPDQLNALFHWDEIVSSATTKNPPIGKYCMVVFLFEHKDSCKEADHNCWDAWMQFPTPQFLN